MKTYRQLSVLAFALTIFGCGPKDSPNVADTSDPDTIVMDELPPTMEDVHAHPEHGPHGGDLVELGKEDFHAELVHSDDGIALFVLDGGATKQVPIESEKLVMSLKHDGQVASFDLVAKPDAEDPDGKSSRFVSADSKLDDWLDAGAEGAVVIQIQGKQYTGAVAHDHDHAGHDH
ncbi:MAG: hypothetical protein AB8B91_24875 [Rubripirellula sp.]